MAHTAAAFIIGDEQLTLDCFNRLRDMLGGRDCEVVSPSDLGRVRTEWMCESFFGPKIIKVDAKDFGVPWATMVADCADKAPKGCLLIVRGKSLPSKQLSTVKKLGEPLVRVLCFPGFKKFEDGSEFVVRKVAEAGSKISEKAADLLVSTCGLHSGFLAQESWKLAGMASEVTPEMVSSFAFPSAVGEFYRFYTRLGDGDAQGSIAEIDALIETHGEEAVDSAMMKLIVVACRMAETNAECIIQVQRNHFNASWWSKDAKSGNPEPSTFMKGVATKVRHRHGIEGIRKLLRKMNRDFDSHRKVAGRPRRGTLEAKALAICGKGGEID